MRKTNRKSPRLTNQEKKKEIISIQVMVINTTTVTVISIKRYRNSDSVKSPRSNVNARPKF